MDQCAQKYMYIHFKQEEVDVKQFFQTKEIKLLSCQTSKTAYLYSLITHMSTECNQLNLCVVICI